MNEVQRELMMWELRLKGFRTPGELLGVLLGEDSSIKRADVVTELEVMEQLGSVKLYRKDEATIMFAQALI